MAAWGRSVLPIRPKLVRECHWRIIIEQARKRGLNTEMADTYTRFLYDDTVYPQISTPSTKINNTALTKDEERLMSGSWRRIEKEDIKATIYTFKVPEPHKQRCRVVHACKINDITTNKPPSYRLKTFDEVNLILSRAAQFNSTQFQCIINSNYRQQLEDTSRSKPGMDNSHVSQKCQWDTPTHVV